MIKLEVKNNIVTLVLNNPPDNRLEKPDFIDIDILHLFLSEKEAKALIIKGAGRHFSAGADLDILLNQQNEPILFSQLTKGKLLLNYIYDLNIPVICAIEGVCFGGGLEIALSAHIRAMSEKAILAFPETIHHLMPGLSGTYALKKYMTLGKSIEMILKNKMFNAEESLKTGFADYICKPKTSFEFAEELAYKLTFDKPLKVINNVMKALKNSYTLSKEEALEQETILFCELVKDVIDNKNV